jgi:hypothetical protein
MHMPSERGEMCARGRREPRHICEMDAHLLLLSFV